MNRKYFISIITVLMLVLMSTPLTQTPSLQISSEGPAVTAEFTSKRILFDESHTTDGSGLWSPGNVSLFSWILGVHGYSSSTNFNESLDSGILSNYDILVIFFPQEPLTAPEIAAVHSFVDAGGSLLLVGVDNINGWQFGVENLNPISETYGIEFNSDLKHVLLNPTYWIDHNITQGVEHLYTKGDDLWGCSLNVTGSATTIVDFEGSPLVATAEAGLGRVVCVGAPAHFYMYRHGFPYEQAHFQFSLNVIDWLADNPWREVTIPETAVITAGSGPALSQQEVSRYTPFVGVYHDHTTVSDGENTPEEMLEQALALGIDYFIMTDHSYSTSAGTKGIEGALALKNIAEPNNLDIKIVVGAELSASYHTVGFPLTENAWTFSPQEAVDAIHAQDAIAILAHPTISPGYGPIYENMTEIGYDGVEITNKGYFFGGGEDALRYSFIAASDGHGAEFVGQVLNVAFVENPTGPMGQISDLDLKQAVLDRRIVCLDKTNGMIIGQKVWVDRFLELMDDAEVAVDSAKTLIGNLKGAGEDVGLSEEYVTNAEIALDTWNPQRALILAQNATSTAALGLDVQIEFPEIIQPNYEFDLPVTFVNNHTYPVSVNTSVYIRESISLDHQSLVMDISGESSTTAIRHCQSNAYGLTWYSLNIHSFNTSEYLVPLVFRNVGIIDSVDYTLEEADGGQEAAISFTIGRNYAIKITSVKLVYDDGVEQNEVEMVEGWNTYDYSLGPYPEDIDITFHVKVTTIFGNVFDLPEQTISWINTTTTTTTGTTTTTTTVPGQPLDPMLLAALGGVGVVVVLVIVIVMKKRGT